MTTRVADDFDAIKKRLEELRKQENKPVTTEATEDTSVTTQQDVHPIQSQDTIEVDDPFCYYAKHPVSAQWVAQKKIWDFYHQAQAHQQQVEAKEQPIGYSSRYQEAMVKYYTSQNLDVKD